MEGQLAQSVRAPASHAGGRWFESTIAHSKQKSGARIRRFFISIIISSTPLLAGSIAVEDISTDIRRIDFDESAHAIHDRPISFGKLRRDLTLEYMRRHYDPGAKDITIVPIYIVIHWTALGSLDDSFRFFNRETLHPDRRDILHGGALNVSAHFLVDRDGTIYRLMPETLMARHVIGLNHCAIGIENVGGPSRPLTNEQVEANAWLVVRLARSYPTIERIMGHHEYLTFRKGPHWRTLDPAYRAYRKIDPGAKFMMQLRERLKDYRRPARGKAPPGGVSCR